MESKSCGSRFCDISTDLFDQVSYYLSGGSILNLWMTGDHGIQYIMANGGIASIELEDLRIGSNSHFPLSLRFFRGLKRLSINRGDNALDNIDCIRKGLQSLSSTLENLTLKFRDSESVLLEDVVLSDSNLCDESMKNIGENAEKVSRLWSLQKYFPKLNVLVLDSFGAPGRLLDHHIANLPDTLTELRLLSNESERTDEMISKLGRNLQFLEFQGEISKSAVKSLPQGLTSLIYRGDFPGHCLKELPASLTHMEASIWQLWHYYLPEVPKALKSLDYRINGEEEDDAVIPSHITELSISEKASNWLQKKNFLPSHLLSLDLFDEFQFHDNIEWPCHMKSLIMRNLVIDPTEVCKVNFPPNLELLAFDSYFASDHPQKEIDTILEILPKNLKSFSTDIIASEALNFSILLNLPSLIFLYLKAPIILSKEFFKRLPRTLECLQLILKEENDYFEEDWLNGTLPPSLTSLYLSVPSTVTTAVLSTLPTKLTELEINVEGCLTRIISKSLPRSLIRLNLSHIEDIEFDAVCELPRSITDLSLTQAKAQFDNLNLPPFLKNFALRRAPIALSVNDVKQLPRMLQSLFIPFGVLTEDVENYKDWPLSLTDLVLKEIFEIPDTLQQTQENYRNGKFLMHDSRRQTQK